MRWVNVYSHPYGREYFFCDRFPMNLLFCIVQVVFLLHAFSTKRKNPLLVPQLTNFESKNNDQKFPNDWKRQSEPAIFTTQFRTESSGVKLTSGTSDSVIYMMISSCFDGKDWRLKRGSCVWNSIPSNFVLIVWKVEKSQHLFIFKRLLVFKYFIPL